MLPSLVQLSYCDRRLQTASKQILAALSQMDLWKKKKRKKTFLKQIIWCVRLLNSTKILRILKHFKKSYLLNLQPDNHSSHIHIHTNTLTHSGQYIQACKQLFNNL